ncbi:hypothetical protein MRX96_037405 [Rhipicephalus microplus]
MRGASAGGERTWNVNSLSGSDERRGCLESRVGGGASTDKTSASKPKQAEAKESEPSASRTFRMITQSGKQCTNLLQLLNLPDPVQAPHPHSAAEGGTAT